MHRSLSIFFPSLFQGGTSSGVAEDGVVSPTHNFFHTCYHVTPSESPDPLGNSDGIPTLSNITFLNPESQRNVGETRDLGVKIIVTVLVMNCGPRSFGTTRRRLRTYDSCGVMWKMIGFENEWVFENMDGVLSEIRRNYTPPPILTEGQNRPLLQNRRGKK
jgi:hypothetical protein